MIKAKKSLGQNFLIDETVLENIVEAVNLSEGDTILEIGPGTGALTKYLIDSPAEVHAIEIDSRAADYLLKNYPRKKHTNFHLFQADFRDFSFKEYFFEVLGYDNLDKKIKVVGNIPYYLSSEIILSLCHNNRYIERAVLTTQKETARRYCARHSTKDYGTLTVPISLLGTARILFDIPGSAFSPPPKVTSSTIEIVFNGLMLNSTEIESIMKIVRQAFNQRRKKITNSLSAFFSEYPEAVDFTRQQFGTNFLDKRADQISPEQYYELYKHSLI